MAYTDKETATVVARYKEGADVKTIASEVGKTVPSVRAKLVAEKVYVPKAKPTATKVREATKAELVAKVEAAAKVEAGTFDGLTGATKAAIEAVHEAFVA